MSPNRTQRARRNALPRVSFEGASPRRGRITKEIRWALSRTRLCGFGAGGGEEEE